MLNWIKGMFGWSVIDEVEERPLTEVKAKAPAKVRRERENGKTARVFKKAGEKI